MDAGTILLPAFVFSLLLIVTHTYFGLHVLARGIIFIDLALAQIAALGASVAFLVGEDAHGATARLYAFAATLLAAAGFAALRRLPDKTTREVVIGSVYVVATALSVLVLSRSVQGMEQLKALLNGSILWVQWDEIALVAGVYAAVLLAHTALRARFRALSFEENGGRNTFLWEFVFFATFALVITFAVHVAGILVVFAFLIIPAFAATLLASGFAARLVWGWGLGVVGSVAGLSLAYTADLPVGATVVSVLGVIPDRRGADRQARRRLSAHRDPAITDDTHATWLPSTPSVTVLSAALNPSRT